VPEFSPEVYVQGAVVDPPEDDDADYEPMEEEPERTEEEALARAMAISEAEERARWIGLEAAIQASQQVLPPPSSPAPENLPPPRPFCP
jgi:non-canonical (house-cleaning) NTP pyrophosphatase